MIPECLSKQLTRT